MSVKITSEIESEIIKLIETKSQKEIAFLYKISKSSVGNIIRKNNIKVNKGRLNMARLPLDVDYFKYIDNKNKAYWLGYICGDGNLNKDFKVTITSKDFEIIERFKQDINSGHTIGENSYYDKRTNKTYANYSIQVRNFIFMKNLVDKGININKSDYLLFPNIDEKYYSYFIAGIFDSDGHIGNIGKKRISLISTKEVLKFISNYISERFNINELKLTKVTENKDNVYKLYLYKDSTKFLNFIYGDKDFKYMSRKYKIFLEKYK